MTYEVKEIDNGFKPFTVTVYVTSKEDAEKVAAIFHDHVELATEIRFRSRGIG